MKRRTVIMLLMALSLTACGNDKEVDTGKVSQQLENLEQDIEKEIDKELDKLEESKEPEDKYGELKLKVYEDDDIEQFQGKIQSYFEGNGHTMIYSNGTLYEAPSSWSDDKEWISWGEHNIKRIIDMDGCCLVEDTDGNLVVYGKTTDNEVYSMKLECTKDNFVYGFHGAASSKYVVIMLNNGVLHTQEYDLIENKVTDTEILYGRYNGEYIELNYLYDLNSTRYGILVDNKYMESDTGVDRDRKDNRAFVSIVSNNATENVTKYFDKSIDGELFTVLEDTENIHLIKTKYESDTYKETKENRYIKLTDGYTTDDIEIVSIENDLIVKFKDNSYYTVGKYEVKGLENNQTVELKEYTKLNDVVKSEHLKEMHFDYHPLVLMDNGYLYEVK